MPAVLLCVATNQLSEPAPKAAAPCDTCLQPARVAGWDMALPALQVLAVPPVLEAHALEGAALKLLASPQDLEVRAACLPALHNALLELAMAWQACRRCACLEQARASNYSQRRDCFCAECKQFCRPELRFSAGARTYLHLPARLQEDSWDVLVVATASSSSASEGVATLGVLVSQPEWGFEAQQELPSPGGPVEDACLQRLQVRVFTSSTANGRVR